MSKGKGSALVQQVALGFQSRTCAAHAGNKSPSFPSMPRPCWHPPQKNSACREALIPTPCRQISPVLSMPHLVLVGALHGQCPHQGSQISRAQLAQAAVHCLHHRCGCVRVHMSHHCIRPQHADQLVACRARQGMCRGGRMWVHALVCHVCGGHTGPGMKAASACKLVVLLGAMGLRRDTGRLVDVRCTSSPNTSQQAAHPYVRLLPFLPLLPPSSCPRKECSRGTSWPHRTAHGCAPAPALQVHQKALVCR